MQRSLWIRLAPVCLVLLSSCSVTPAQGPISAPGSADSLATRDGLVAGLRKVALPLTGKADDYNSLMTQIGDARLVLLGEATHGTHEFYRERMRITQRLIREKGFSAIVIEGDWPDAYRVNQYVRGHGRDATAEQALSSFTRFPHWMWRNTDVRDLVQWLRQHNAALPPTAPRAGFYGMDVYSLPSSVDAVAQHLERRNPEAARTARERYRCFAAFRSEPEMYGLANMSNAASSCETGARQQLQDVQRLYDAQRTQKPEGQPVTAARSSRTDAARTDAAGLEELFSALQNARVVKNAEEYYRIMYRGGTSSWNLRDKHMADTLDALLAHHDAPGKPAKVVVWAHNSHVGDARMTTMGESGEWTVGQLMRERHKDQTFLLGFTTYTGTVMAATEWGERGQVERVRPGLPGSFAALFHETGIRNFLLPLRGQGDLVLAMGEPRLERAIGVVYLPQTERESHYFQARMSKQFDAVIHLDVTKAVSPLRP